MTPLRQRVSEDMQARNLSPHTRRSNLQQVSQFARHFGRSPDLLGPDDIRTYQLHLTLDKRFSASSILVDRFQATSRVLLMTGMGTLFHGSAGWSRRGGGVRGCLQFPEIGCPPCRSKPMPLAGTTSRDNGTG
jgi:hypothetical protein